MVDFNLQVARVTSQVNASVGDRVRRQTGVCVTVKKIVLKLVDTWIASRTKRTVGNSTRRAQSRPQNELQ